MALYTPTTAPPWCHYRDFHRRGSRRTEICTDKRAEQYLCGCHDGDGHGRSRIFGSGAGESPNRFGMLSFVKRNLGAQDIL